MTSAATSFWHLVQQKSPNGPRKISWPWILVAIFLPVLGSKLLIGRFASGLVALSAWVGAEFAVRRGMNPLAGPWARAGSPRGEVLRMLWPLWRLGFALNVLLVFGAATFLEGRQWVIFGTLTPWVIFTSLGVLSAILHNLAGSPARLEKVLLQTRHIFYLIIGFGPFGVCCILGSASVLLIRLWSKGDRQLTQIRSRRMGQYVFRLILRYLEFIGFIRVRFKDLSAPSGRARLLIGNHISMFDIITILAHVEQCGTFVKEKYAKMPIMRQIIDACGFIPIDPESYESRQSGMMRAREALARGETFVAWPEGTRSKDGSLGVFHNGIFRLALEVGISVTPVVFTSSGPVFNNRGRFRETPRTVIFTATLEPKIIFNQPNRVTPGRVVLCRDSVRNFFLERLSQADIPEWMRLSSCWREKSESDFCRPPTGSESAERQSSELLCDVSDLIPRSARAKSLQDAENFDHAQSLGRVGMESI